MVLGRQGGRLGQIERRKVGSLDQKMFVGNFGLEMIVLGWVEGLVLG